MKQGGPGPTPRRRPGDKPFIPFARFEDVVVKCGHVEKFGLLPRERPLPQRSPQEVDEQRLQGMSDQKAHGGASRHRSTPGREGTAKEPGRREAGPFGQAPAATEGPAARRVRFDVTFDATKGQWSGTLTIPVAGGEPATFTGSGSGLFPLLGRLGLAVPRHPAPTGIAGGRPMTFHIGCANGRGGHGVVAAVDCQFPHQGRIGPISRSETAAFPIRSWSNELMSVEDFPRQCDPLDLGRRRRPRPGAKITSVERKVEGFHSVALVGAGKVTIKQTGKEN